jgi:hypothetical protein
MGFFLGELSLKRVAVGGGIAALILTTIAVAGAGTHPAVRVEFQPTVMPVDVGGKADTAGKDPNEKPECGRGSGDSFQGKNMFDLLETEEGRVLLAQTFKSLDKKAEAMLQITAAIENCRHVINNPKASPEAKIEAQVDLERLQALIK